MKRINLKTISKFFFFSICIIIREYNLLNLNNKVLNQTYKNLEVLIIDDGSTDNTKEIIDKFSDKRVKYIKLKENLGSSNARNIGIKMATGKYKTIIFVMLFHFRIQMIFFIQINWNFKLII